MKPCEMHEMELSALIDGEATVESAGEAIEHALGCAACARFFRAARRLDAAARRAASDESDASENRSEELWLQIRRRATAAGATASTPRRATAWRALRAAALVALGLGGGYWWSSVDGTAATARAEATAATVARTAPAMDERRFVAVADELLGADLRYQRAMLEVLKLVPALDSEELGRDDEARPIVRTSIRDDGPRAGLL